MAGKNRNNDQRRKLSISIAVFLLLFLPTLAFGIYYYRTENDTLTNDVISHRETVASLSASAIKLKLDHLVGVAQAFAENASLAPLIGRGEWDAAISEAEVLSNQEQFYDYYVDRILILDAKGVVQAAYPRLNGGIGAEDISIGEWRSTLLAGQVPSFVSNVYKRRAEPRINVVEVLAPVIDSNDAVIGVIALQIPINAFSDFGKDIDLSSSGFAYFVDRLGHIITHPKFSSDGPIVDYSGAPSVQNLLQGKQGVAIAFNPVEQQERLSAYQLVPTYGWGVVSTEAVNDAFASRDDILLHIAYLIAAISAIELLLAYIVFRTL